MFYNAVCDASRSANVLAQRVMYTDLIGLKKVKKTYELLRYRQIAQTFLFFYPLNKCNGYNTFSYFLFTASESS